MGGGEEWCGGLRGGVVGDGKGGCGLCDVAMWREGVD